MKFTVGNHALMPANTAAVSWLNAREIGEPIHVTALTDSEMKFRSFVFMALTKVAAAADMPFDKLRAKLQIELGLGQWIKIGDRRVIAVKSMNVMTMSHDELKQFWEDAHDIITAMLPTFAPEAAEEIEKLLRS